MLMIVTKNQSVQDIETLISKGFRLFGENRDSFSNYAGRSVSGGKAKV